MEWIKTKERLPEEDVDVLVYNAWKGKKELAYMHRQGTYPMWYDAARGEMINNPTHWCELPGDPKKDD